MPNRIIRAGINRSDRVDQLDCAAEVFYRRLLNEVDDHGLFDARPSVLRAALFALRLDRVREADIQRWIAACEKSGLVVLYEADGKPYLKVLNTGWEVRSKPKFPLPPSNCEQLRATENNCAPLSESLIEDGIRSSESKKAGAAKPQRLFSKPSVDEVKAYCTDRKNAIDAESFVDFYESKGWRIGKEPMRDWKAAVRTWEKRENGNARGTTHSQAGARQRPANPGSTAGSEDEWADRFAAQQAGRGAEAGQDVASQCAAG